MLNELHSACCMRVKLFEQVVARADCGARPDARRGWARRAPSTGRRAATVRRCRPACARSGRAAACWRPAAPRAPAAWGSRPAGRPLPAPHSRRRAWTAASAAWAPGRCPRLRPPRLPRTPQQVRPVRGMCVSEAWRIWSCICMLVTASPRCWRWCLCGCMLYLTAGPVRAGMAGCRVRALSAFTSPQPALPCDRCERGGVQRGQLQLLRVRAHIGRRGARGAGARQVQH